MTILNSGATTKYSDNWEKAFGEKQKKRSTSKASAKKKTTAKKSAKKKSTTKKSSKKTVKR